MFERHLNDDVLLNGGAVKLDEPLISTFDGLQGQCKKVRGNDMQDPIEVSEAMETEGEQRRLDIATDAMPGSQGQNSDLAGGQDGSRVSYASVVNSSLREPLRIRMDWGTGSTTETGTIRFLSSMYRAPAATVPPVPAATIPPVPAATIPPVPAATIPPVPAATTSTSALSLQDSRPGPGPGPGPGHAQHQSQSHIVPYLLGERVAVQS
ncbi:hypothetical protein V6N12_057747 [Hibiscus sabdariffa]|uniref:Uncharacterized protein n=1 Tax=Hibiscus sabdariffa TaxID=183260 RepID=A0ABR2C607_9ROSI